MMIDGQSPRLSRPIIWMTISWSTLLRLWKCIITSSISGSNPCQPTKSFGWISNALLMLSTTSSETCWIEPLSYFWSVDLGMPISCDNSDCVRFLTFRNCFIFSPKFKTTSLLSSLIVYANEQHNAILTNI